ncbi:hypothetical protein LAZ67_16002612 [Cordylochernes scorpioides]|uniref:Uncharacterized protein n=1 Tax=Cordylochernes scorpioides TaxID=51811 RepID=A0ABY6LDE6_9ARAC|nr:hypothetical protein LAZ67_16002612 [Cordylochernes scorpioides]
MWCAYKVWCLELYALVNNAGVCIGGEFEWNTPEHQRFQVEVNLLGTLRCTQAFLPLLRKSKGRVINVTSVNAQVPYPGFAVYGATKAGIEAFSDALRMELRKFDVKVIIVRPGDYARLTSLFAGQSRRAEEMWTAMDTERRQAYGSYFRSYQDYLIQNNGLTSPPSFERSNLLPVFEEALCSPNPKSLYTAAPFWLRFFLGLVSMLPSSWSDRLILFLYSQTFKFNYELGAQNDGVLNIKDK